MKKTILKGAAMLLGGVLLGTLLMIAAYAIPSETVWENVRVSAQTLANEGLRYEAIDGYHASRLDDFTDAIMIGNAVLTTEDPVESAMTARHFAGGETIGTLMRYLDGEDVPTESYARYWHGYLAALKPLLMVMNLNSIRVLNMYAQLALVLWTAALMVRRGLSRHVLALFAAYASLCPAAVMQSLQYSTAFYVAFGAMAVLLWTDGRMNDALFFMAVGMLTSFVDFLTYPIATLGLPLAARMALRQKQEKPCGLADFVKICLSWGIGYAGMWSGKWLMAALLTGQNVFAEAGSAMGNRLGAVDDSGVELALTTGVQENLRIMFNPLTVLMLLGVLAARRRQAGREAAWAVSALRASAHRLVHGAAEPFGGARVLHVQGAVCDHIRGGEHGDSDRKGGDMSGKKKRSRWIGALAALLGVVCALILCALFYGTMVYQLAGESGEDAAPAGGTLALSAGTLEDESRQNIRMGGKTCDVLTRTYRLEGGAQVQAVTASPAAYIERMKEEGWQAQLITGFAIGPLDAIYAVSGESAMLCAQSGQTVYMILAQADENALYALGADAVFE